MIFDAYIYLSIYITLFSHCSDNILVIVFFEMMTIISFSRSVPPPPHISYVLNHLVISILIYFYLLNLKKIGIVL